MGVSSDTSSFCLFMTWHEKTEKRYHERWCGLFDIIKPHHLLRVGYALARWTRLSLLHVFSSLLLVFKNVVSKKL